MADSRTFGEELKQNIDNMIDTFPMRQLVQTKVLEKIKYVKENATEHPTKVNLRFAPINNIPMTREGISQELDNISKNCKDYNIAFQYAYRSVNEHECYTMSIEKKKPQ